LGKWNEESGMRNEESGMRNVKCIKNRNNGRNQNATA
jgi:hypothetical protein